MVAAASDGAVVVVPVAHVRGRDALLQPNQRVVVAGKVEGVIRFVGATDFAPGRWYGIECDEPVGKNDGSVQGKAYFPCQPRHGIFCPASQISLKPQPVRVGDAVVLLGDRRATVQYVGPTDFAPGLWVGVELEAPEGRHDGSVQGRQYFTCKSNHGLFAAPSRVIKLVKTPANSVGIGGGSSSGGSARRQEILAARALEDVEQLQADLDAARQEASVLTARLKQLESNLSPETKDTMALQAELDDARTTASIAQSDLATSRAQVKRLEASLMERVYSLRILANSELKTHNGAAEIEGVEAGGENSSGTETVNSQRLWRLLKTAQAKAVAFEAQLEAMADHVEAERLDNNQTVSQLEAKLEMAKEDAEAFKRQSEATIMELEAKVAAAGEAAEDTAAIDELKQKLKVATAEAETEREKNKTALAEIKEELEAAEEAVAEAEIAAAESDAAQKQSAADVERLMVELEEAQDALIAMSTNVAPLEDVVPEEETETGDIVEEARLEEAETAEAVEFLEDVKAGHEEEVQVAEIEAGEEELEVEAKEEEEGNSNTTDEEEMEW